MWHLVKSGQEVTQIQTFRLWYLLRTLAIPQDNISFIGVSNDGLSIRAMVSGIRCIDKTHFDGCMYLGGWFIGKHTF